MKELNQKIVLKTLPAYILYIVYPAIPSELPGIFYILKNSSISFCRPQHIFPSGQCPVMKHVGP